MLSALNAKLGVSGMKAESCGADPPSETGVGQIKKPGSGKKQKKGVGGVKGCLISLCAHTHAEPVVPRSPALSPRLFLRFYTSRLAPAVNHLTRSLGERERVKEERRRGRKRERVAA